MYVYFLLAHISLVPSAVLVVPHVPPIVYCQLSTCPSPECLISVWAVCMGPGDTARTSVWCTVYSVQYIHCTVYSGHHGTTLTWSQLEMSRRAVTSLCEWQYVIL